MKKKEIVKELRDIIGPDSLRIIECGEEKIFLDKLSSLADKIEGKESKKEWPKVGDRVWCLFTNGIVADCYFNSVFMGELKMGNIFRTKKEAEAEREKRFLITALWQEPGARKFVKGEDNWQIFCEGPIIGATMWTRNNYLTNLPFFDTSEKGRAVIGKYGDRLKILL